MDATSEPCSEVAEPNESQLEPTTEQCKADNDVSSSENETRMETELPTTSAGDDSEPVDDSTEQASSPTNNEDSEAVRSLVDSPTCNDDEGTTSSQETPSTSDNNDVGSVYYLKWFSWNGETYPIVTQNENGPCPLLAIMNVLTLSKRIALPYMQEIVTAQQLMEYLGDCILSSGPQHTVEDELVLNFEQNMQDAISIMHKLQTGIDVNVRFTGVKDFEYTPECVVFDLLSTGLCHGWLMDPQDEAVVKAIASHSYNQIVEKIILSKEDGAAESLVQEGLVAELFLERTRSQLTYHGLCELNNTIKDGELCVFFRNNHFSTLYKYKGELFLLVTDQGYLTESQVIWETLANVEGDGQFVDSAFQTIAPKTDPQEILERSSEGNLTQQQQDYLVALSLRDQEQSEGVASVAADDVCTPEQQQQREQQDFALAIQLQNEENHRLAAAAAARQQQPQQQQQRPPSNPQQRQRVNGGSAQQNSRGNCVIL